MKAKTMYIALLFLFIILLNPPRSQAQENASGSSASFSQLLVERQADNRVPILRAYLEQLDSPLAPYADTFVNQADLYNLDWRLVAAIAGRESTFAKDEPCINPFGYDIYGTQTRCFTDYNDAIKTVSKSLREQYINQWGAENIYDIGKFYAASPTWASGVLYFMDDIQKFAFAQPAPLPISL